MPVPWFSAGLSDWAVLLEAPRDLLLKKLLRRSDQQKFVKAVPSTVVQSLST